MEIPLVLPTHHSRINLHILAGWIWASGGKFLSEDRSKAIFDLPEALAGMEKFFRLSRYLHPSACRLDDSQSMRFSGKARPRWRSAARGCSIIRMWIRS